MLSLNYKEIHFKNPNRTYKAMTAPHNVSVIIKCSEFYLAMAVYWL